MCGQLYSQCHGDGLVSHIEYDSHNLHMEALVRRRMTSGKRKWAHENPERFFGDKLAKLKRKRLTDGVLFR